MRAKENKKQLKKEEERFKYRQTTRVKSSSFHSSACGSFFLPLVGKTTVNPGPLAAIPRHSDSRSGAKENI
jgi:hypothetical protein